MLARTCLRSAEVCNPLSRVYVSLFSSFVSFGLLLFRFDNRRQFYPILRLFVMDRIGMSVSESQDV